MCHCKTGPLTTTLRLLTDSCASNQPNNSAMYSRQYFINEFRHIDSDELLERLATSDLTDVAKDAIHTVLRERGITDERLDALVQQAKKDTYKRTTPTNECDYCGKSLRLLGSVKDGGQKFCSNDCLRTSRLMEAAVDIPEKDIQEFAYSLRRGPCPNCREKKRDIEIRKYYWVWSAAIFTQWGVSTKVCCKTCGVKANLASILGCVALGWWGIPWGILMTPVQVLRNLSELLRRIDKNKPSDELLLAAKLKLAEARRKPESEHILNNPLNMR